MKAFMYRFLPLTERAIKLVTEELGEVRAVTSVFMFRMPDDATDIQLDPELDGGSALDVGTYAVSAARQFLGEPETVYATTHDARDCGVDTEMTGVLEYDTGAIARVQSGFETPLTQYYRVETTDGWLRAEPTFDVGVHGETSLTYGVDARETTEVFEPADHYRHEVEHFADCVAEGKTPRVDRAESVAHAGVLDAIFGSTDTETPVHLDG